MPKEGKYKVAKMLIETGTASSFIDIFKDGVKKTPVAKDFGTNNTRFTHLMNNVGRFRVDEVYALAKLFDVDYKKLFELIHTQIANSKRKKIGPK